MIFYIDNKIDQKQDFNYQELIHRFINDSRAYENYLYGAPFERCFLNTLPGTPDPVMISEEDWEALKQELNRQVPNPEFQV